VRPTIGASRDELPQVLGEAARAIDWENLRAIALSFSAGTDPAPLLKGLPNDLCFRPHWDYVIKGGMRVLRAGDLHYLPPGHTGVVEEDCGCIACSAPAAN